VSGLCGPAHKGVISQRLGTPSGILIKRKSRYLSMPFVGPHRRAAQITGTAGGATRDFTEQSLLVERDAAEFLFPVQPATSCGTSGVSL
jgi:hypothetical protein